MTKRRSLESELMKWHSRVIHPLNRLRVRKLEKEWQSSILNKVQQSYKVKKANSFKSSHVYMPCITNHIAAWSKENNLTTDRTLLSKWTTTATNPWTLNMLEKNIRENWHMLWSIQKA
jgi:hypothetical protein